MQKAIICTAVAASLTLAGCTTIDPYTREEKTSDTVKGAGIGAAAGAVIGAISGGTRGAMIGAGIGALAGAAVGSYMDQQEAELRERLEGTGVSVTRDGDNLILNMPGNVTFDFNRGELQSSFYEVLNSVALVLKKYEKTGIEIIGHTDSIGSESYNRDLSLRRAESVAAYLEGQGVQRLRMEVMGMGESRPVADNTTEAGRSQNRRVELILIPLTAG
ncbi:MAG: OmpA family protein [Chromatiales bacterium]